MGSLDSVVLDWNSIAFEQKVLSYTQDCSKFWERLRLRTCLTQGRSTHYWLVRVIFFLRFIPKPCLSAFQKISFVYPGCKANSLCCTLCTVVTPKLPFLGKVDSHFLIENLIIGLHRRSHSVSLQCLSHAQYPLQPGYHFPYLSSLSFSSFWRFLLFPTTL